MNAGDLQPERTVAQRELDTLLRIAQYYFGALLLLYAFFFVLYSLPEADSYRGIVENSIPILYLFFGFPLLLSIIYFFRIPVALLQRQYDVALICIMVVLLGAIIGGGVCFANLVAVSSLIM